MICISNDLFILETLIRDSNLFLKMERSSLPWSRNGYVVFAVNRNLPISTFIGTKWLHDVLEYPFLWCTCDIRDRDEECTCYSSRDGNGRGGRDPGNNYQLVCHVNKAEDNEE